MKLKSTVGEISMEVVNFYIQTTIYQKVTKLLVYVFIQNLVKGCEKFPQITAESSDTPPIHCAQHVQQSVDMSIQLPAGLQCDLVQMVEIVQQEYVLVGIFPAVYVYVSFRFKK